MYFPMYTWNIHVLNIFGKVLLYTISVYVSQILKNVTHPEVYNWPKFEKNTHSRFTLPTDKTSRSSSNPLLPTSSTLQAYLAKPFRSPAPATTCDILYSTSNSHQVMRMSCSTEILTLIFKIRHLHSTHNTEDHHHRHLNLLLWPDTQEKQSLYNLQMSLLPEGIDQQ